MDVQTILNLNGIQADWPLQIEQKLLIDPGNVTPTPTPRPLTPVEKLTPESDGNYYHTVESGETLSWIAGLYEIRWTDLMLWNGMSQASVIYPGQKLLLQVTPPATETPTPGPATVTPTATEVPPTQTPTLRPSPAATQTAGAARTSASFGGGNTILYVSLGLAAGGLFLFVFFSRKK